MTALLFNAAAHAPTGSPCAPTSGVLTQDMAALACSAAHPQITVRMRDCTVHFDARDIDRFFADRKYVCFYHDGKEQILDESLLHLAQQLQQFGFIRVRRNELINMKSILRVRRLGRTLQLQLRNGGGRVVVSRRLCGFVRAKLCGAAGHVDCPGRGTRPRASRSMVPQAGLQPVGQGC